MAIGVVDALFLDTTLVYATVPAAPLHAAAAAALSSYKAAGYDLWISRQILREYLAVLSRPQTFSPGFSAAQLVQQCVAFQAQFRVADEPQLFPQADLETILSSFDSIPGCR